MDNADTDRLISGSHTGEKTVRGGKLGWLIPLLRPQVSQIIFPRSLDDPRWRGGSTESAARIDGA
jgi:hypothetical protein